MCHSSYSAAAQCADLSGMDDPDKIPETDMVLPTNNGGSPVSQDPDGALVIAAGEDPATIILDVGGSDTYPDDAPIVDRLEFVVGSIENVGTINISYQPDGSDGWTTVSPNVRFYHISSVYSAIEKPRNARHTVFMFVGCVP